MPAAVRYLTLHRLAFTITALTVLITAISVSAAAAFSASVTSVASRDTLIGNQAARMLLTAQTTDVPAATAEVTRTLRAASPGLPMSFVTSEQSNPLNLPSRLAGPKAQVLLMSLPQVQANAALVTGRWPVATDTGAIQVCMPASAATLLHLGQGSQLAVRDSTSGTLAHIRVVCTFREQDPAQAYWELNQIGPAGVSREGGFTLYGPLMTSQPPASWPVRVNSAGWLAQPDFAIMTAGNLATLGNSIGNALTQLANSQSLQAVVTTSLPALLEGQAVAIEVERSQLLIGVLILLVMAGATLGVAVHLLASQRAGQPGLLRARGAGRWQLAARGATDAGLLAVPAAVAGPLIGSWLAPILSRVGAGGSVSLRLPSGLPIVAWLAGISAAVGCAFIIALPWLRNPLSSLAHRGKTARRNAIAVTVTTGADIALIVLAAGAAWQLEDYAAPVTTGLNGTIGVDPVLVAAPVLALSAGTLVMLRLLPVLVGLAERLASRGRGITVSAAIWLISRRTLRQAGPALLTVLAVAIAVLALGETTSWQRSVRDQASFMVGADTRVNLAPASELPIGEAGDVAAAPGVTAATPVLRIPFTIQAGNTLATLLAINSPQAAKIVPLRSDLAIKPAGDPLAPISDSDIAGVPLPGRAEQVQILASLTGAGRTAFPTTGISGATLSVLLTDGSGAAYQVGNVPLAPNGAIQKIVIPLPGGHADYPLTLTGLSLAYTMPATKPGQVATLTIHSVSVADGYGRPARQLPAVVSSGPGQSVIVSAPPVAPIADTPTGFCASMNYCPGLPSGVPHLVRYLAHGAGLRISFTIGAGAFAGGYGNSPDSGSVSITPRVPGVLPGIATKAFIAASGLTLGDIVEVNGTQAPVAVRLVGEMAQFPTITPPGGAVIVNQAALQFYEAARDAGPLDVSEWWLRGPGRPQLAELPAGATITTLAGVTQSLRGQPLSVAPLAALAAVAVVALLLASAGFLVSVSSSEDQGRDLAVLDALGASPGQLIGLRCMEQAMVSVPAAGGGLVLGLFLSRLIIPAVTITPEATQPIPAVLVLIPLGPAMAIAVAVSAIPVVAVALAMLSGTATLARLRAEEQT